MFNLRCGPNLERFIGALKQTYANFTSQKYICGAQRDFWSEALTYTHVTCSRDFYYYLYGGLKVGLKKALISARWFDKSKL